MMIGSTFMMLFLAAVGLSASGAQVPSKSELPGEVISFNAIDPSHGVTAMAMDGNYLYTAGNGEFAVYDLRSTPKKVGTLKGLPSWSMRQMAVRRHYAYITARHLGLVVIDVREPKRPRLVRIMPTEELATGIATHGDALYIAQRVYGVEIFDLTDPESPQHVNLVRSACEAQSVYCSGKLMATGDWGSASVTIFDISKPSVPVFLSEIHLDGFGDGVFLDGNTLYASTGHHSRHGDQKSRFGRGHGMEIFDISDPQKPVRLGGVKFPPYYELGNDFWSVQVVGNTAYCADTSNGLYVVDVSDKKNPTVKRSLRLGPSRCNPANPECVSSMAIGKKQLFFGGSESGLFRFADSNAAPLKVEEVKLPFCAVPEAAVPEGLTRIDLGGPVRRLATRGDIVFAAMAQYGLKIFRVMADGSVKVLGGNTKHTVYDVAVSGELLAVAEDMYQIGVYRISDDGSLREIGRFRGKSHMPIQHIRFFLGGKLLSATGGTGRINFFSFANPAEPALIRYFSEPRLFYSDVLSDEPSCDVIFANLAGGGIIRYTLNDKKVVRRKAPVFSKNIEQINAAAKLYEYQIIPYKGMEYLLLRADVESPVWEESVFTADAPVSGIPQWNGKNVIVFSERRNGKLTLFRCDDPKKLRKVTEFNVLPGTPDRAVFVQNRVLIPTNNGGLYLSRELDTFLKK